MCYAIRTESLLQIADHTSHYEHSISNLNKMVSHTHPSKRHTETSYNHRFVWTYCCHGRRSTTELTNHNNNSDTNEIIMLRSCNYISILFHGYADSRVSECETVTVELCRVSRQSIPQRNQSINYTIILEHNSFVIG